MAKILLNFTFQNEPGRLAMFVGHSIIATYSLEAKPIKSLELHYILIIITLTIHAHNQSDGRICSQITTSLQSEKKNFMYACL